MTDYDSIIIGAGHNGLVCAAYLAKAGQRVLVLDAAASPGGLAASREFHPGFRAPVAHMVTHFSEKIVAELDLTSHRFKPQSFPTTGVGPDRKHVVIEGDVVAGVSETDIAAYTTLVERLRRFAKVLQPFWLKTMPRIGNSSPGELLTFAHMGLNLRRLGKNDMRELLRIASLPTRDLVEENFNDTLLKSILNWDGLVGARLAPRSPNAAVLLMLYRMAGVQASAGNLVNALVGAAESAGAEIRCSAEVDRIQIDSDSNGLLASGVHLADGELITATRVISSADPKRTFLGLVGVEHLDIGFTNRIRRLRCDGYVAKLHLALNAMPQFSGLKDLRGRLLIAPEMDAIEFAFDNAKYGECPDEPVLEFAIPSLHDENLAPPGQHVLSAHVMYVPYALKGGWTDSARDKMCDKAIAALGRYASGIREQIIHSEFLTPADLEREYRVTGGHWHHTEFAMDQLLMMRPTYEAAQYSTPIPGLYLCGAGSHPGGDLHGGAGHNAARAILQ